MPYITPENTPTEFLSWRVLLPNDERFLAAFLGQLTEMAQSWNWEQTTGITIDDTVALAIDAYDSFERNTLGMIGSLVHYATTNAPANILPCDGSQYLRADYPDLYSALLPSYIVDADNFVTPTIEDIFLIGAGINYPAEDTGGEVEHTLTVAEMPAHIHNSDYPTFTLDIKSAGAPDLTSGGNPPVPHATSSAGGDSPHNNMPPYIAFKVGIVAK